MLHDRQSISPDQRSSNRFATVQRSGGGRAERPAISSGVASALKLLMPTFRVGPVLLDPSAVRVPKTTGLPKQQVFTARPDPATWHDDPIAAATQDALLPPAAAVVREGYVRITLPEPTEQP